MKVVYSYTCKTAFHKKKFISYFQKYNYFFTARYNVNISPEKFMFYLDMKV